MLPRNGLGTNLGTKMSDAAKDAKNLDVISSVRRKVQSGKTGGKSKTMGIDKLILTASLRVDDGTDMRPVEQTPVVADAPEAVVMSDDQPAHNGDPLSDDGMKSDADPDVVKMDNPVETVAAEDSPAEDVVVDVDDSPVEQSPVEIGAAEDAAEIDSTAEVVAVEVNPADDTGNQEVSASGSSLVASNTPPMDEDMLRDLISEIVRQELQGELGEKITRNVRKLVRREIHRTMVSNDLS